MGSWVPQIPELAHHLDLDPQSLGLVLLATGIGALTAMPMAARLGRRWGTRRLAVAGGVWLPCVLATAPLAPSAAIAALVLFLAAVGGACMDIAMNAQGVLVEEALGARSLSVFHGLFSLGCFAGSAAASSLLAQGFSAAATAASVAVVIALISLASWPVLLPSHPSAAGSGASPERVVSPVLLLLGALTFAAFVCEGGLGDWSALLLRTTRHLGAGTSGLGFSAFAAAMVLARFGGDRLTARLGEPTVLRAGNALAALGLLVVLLAPALPLVFAGFFLVGLGLANPSPILYRLAGRVSTTSPEAGLSVTVGLGYAGLLGGPPLLGILAHHAGLPSIFVALLALQVAAFLTLPLVLSVRRTGVS